MRILVVDDDYVSRTQIKSLLSHHGDCDAASSGEIALLMVRAAHAEDASYELITVDIEMPHMNGHQMLRNLRVLERELDAIAQDREAKVLMISAMGDGNNIFASFREGCEGYIVKPVSAAKLQSALSELGLSS